MINTILFDLDGTLLPLDDDHFIKLYFGIMKSFMDKNGYDGSAVTKAVIDSIDAMYQNKGTMTNEEAFWHRFKQLYPHTDDSLVQAFDQFYEFHFDHVRASTKPHPLAKKIIRLLKEKGYLLVLATNPLFPPIATKKRIEWADLNHSDFEMITTFDNSSYTKPRLEYYQSILSKINKRPEECMMIGNDATEDMASVRLGLSSYLLTDCLINSDNTDITRYPHGNFDELYLYLEKLPKIN